MKNKSNNLAPLILFSEITTIDQLIRAQISKILPDGMAISHLSVLNHLSSNKNEKTPMQLAKSFHVTKGAMTNTLSKLEASGHVNIRPDWNDARKKQVKISKKDTPGTLAKKILKQEHKLYPKALLKVFSL